VVRGQAALFCAALCVGCGSQEVSPAAPAEAAGPVSERSLEGLSPSAHPEIVEMLREDRAAERHASDGGGRAWIDTSEGSGFRAAPSGGMGRYPILYEAGPLGVAEGGWVVLQVPPYWDWSDPQPIDPRAPGYTEVSTGAEGVVLTPVPLGESVLGVEISGRALAAGERIRFDYGAGDAGARADRFAERGSRFFLAVDGDGDGIRAFVADAPAVDVPPGPPARLVLSGPSTAEPGEEVKLRLALLDARGSAGVDVPPGDVELKLPEGLAGPGVVALGAGAVAEVALHTSVPGVFRVQATSALGLEAESNPLWVAPGAPRVLWGDLHGHSGDSDGTGLPEDYFAYARDVAGLDVVALTDHDHWGIPFLDESPERWEALTEVVARFHDPGRFVALLGFEWTSWLHGHRHVLYFEDRGDLLSSFDESTDRPEELWAALRGRPALTFAHHSAGGPVATNWAIPPDPELEPVTEVTSVHGSSEAPDSPNPIYAPVEGNFVRDVLGRGYRLGFVGSGDTHDGHPGLGHLAAPVGGLAAIVGAERTRAGVLAALRARRVYATNGPRILLQAALGGGHMGETVPPGDHPLFVRVIAESALERVDLVRGAEVVVSLRVPAEQREALFDVPFEGLEPGEFLYVRAVQVDGGAAWSSPFFVGPASSGD
jgi:hypothetical protein